MGVSMFHCRCNASGKSCVGHFFLLDSNWHMCMAMWKKCVQVFISFVVLGVVIFLCAICSLYTSAMTLWLLLHKMDLLEKYVCFYLFLFFYRSFSLFRKSYVTNTSYVIYIIQNKCPFLQNIVNNTS